MSRKIYIEHIAGGPIGAFEIESETDAAIWYQNPAYSSQSRLDKDDNRIWGYSMNEALLKKRNQLIKKIEERVSELRQTRVRLCEINTSLGIKNEL